MSVSSLPEQPVLLDFDVHSQCGAYQLPDGNVAVIGPDLQLHVVWERDYSACPAPADWVRQLHQSATP